jgi:hypothetical protein
VREGTIDNFESYVWDEHKGAAADGKDVKEKPVGTDCDQLMCVKYGIATKPDKMGADKSLQPKRTQGGSEGQRVRILRQIHEGLTHEHHSER